jgi:hypothetical protein
VRPALARMAARDLCGVWCGSRNSCCVGPGVIFARPFTLPLLLTVYSLHFPAWSVSYTDPPFTCLHCTATFMDLSSPACDILRNCNRTSQCRQSRCCPITFQGCSLLMLMLCHAIPPGSDIVRVQCCVCLQGLPQAGRASRTLLICALH